MGAAFGVMIGSMLVFSSLALLDTTILNFETYFAVGQFDLRATSGQLRPIDDLQSEVKKIRGVQEVQGALAGVVSIKRSGRDDFSTLSIVVDETRGSRTIFYDLDGAGEAVADWPAEEVICAAKVLFVDPAEGKYDGLPRADYILITDIHFDHMAPTVVDKLRKPGTVILAPKAVAATVKGCTIVSNGETKTVGAFKVRCRPVNASDMLALEGIVDPIVARQRVLDRCVLTAWREAVGTRNAERMAGFYADDPEFRWIEDGMVRWELIERRCEQDDSPCSS